MKSLKFIFVMIFVFLVASSAEALQYFRTNSIDKCISRSGKNSLVILAEDFTVSNGVGKFGRTDRWTVNKGKILKGNDKYPKGDITTPVSFDTLPRGFIKGMYFPPVKGNKVKSGIYIILGTGQAGYTSFASGGDCQMSFQESSEGTFIPQAKLKIRNEGLVKKLNIEKPLLFKKLKIQRVASDATTEAATTNKSAMSVSKTTERKIAAPVRIPKETAIETMEWLVDNIWYNQKTQKEEK